MTERVPSSFSPAHKGRQRPPPPQQWGASAQFRRRGRNSAASPEQHETRAANVGISAFAEHGITTAGMHRVAERLEISPSYLFRLFACVDALVDELARPDTDVEKPIGNKADDLHALLSAIAKDTVPAHFCLQVLAEASRNRDVAKKCQSAFAGLPEVGHRMASVIKC